MNDQKPLDFQKLLNQISHSVAKRSRVHQVPQYLQPPKQGLIPINYVANISPQIMEAGAWHELIPPQNMMRMVDNVSSNDITDDDAMAELTLGCKVTSAASSYPVWVTTENNTVPLYLVRWHLFYFVTSISNVQNPACCEDCDFRIHFQLYISSVKYGNIENFSPCFSQSSWERYDPDIRPGKYASDLNRL